ncbi:type 2 phosphatidylinositol 4,5-bisphosphate 4-phosphatase-like isoform X2 [Varroa jacobsoni]|uniref:type 2 phosphatidylinositol 4,5-bisphosphate 4-phosphatase-like isoform X2 n=1 Tax=Varroa jacobsoni TaxID=62625 RepID=UPI000BF3A85B|nr:type 2 phosphatidylinositol 4,5-bisphosphate 4-phosphatase-like isoform X2 [Varroa jacobsoni]
MRTKRQKPRMEEWKPLLGAESSLNPLVFDAPPMAAPPSYSEIQQEIAGMGIPDPTSDIIMCEVCNYPINRSGAERKKVIMCPRCQEATALGEPEKGKRYLRCPDCKCLLIVRTNCKQTICPRENCKLEIDVKTGKPARDRTSASAFNTPTQRNNQEPQYRIVCGYCHGAFVQSVLPAKRLQCPLCRKKSHIGEGSGHRSAACYTGLGLACIVICIAFMATTMGLRHNAGYWYMYTILLLAATGLIVVGLWNLCMRHSTLQITNFAV